MEYRSELATSLMMGPSSLRIAEELCSKLVLKPGSRILDLGCGRGLSTLYLAERFPDSLIVASDLWIEPGENLQTFIDAGVADRVIPIRAEAHALPYAENYFDLVLSIDSWHYYGADPDYMETHVAPLVVPGGRLLVAVPGWKAGSDGKVPDVLKPWVNEDMHFHTGTWWQELWGACPLIHTSGTRDLVCNSEAWADWLTCDNEHAIGDIPMMKAEAGAWFAMVALEATRVSGK